MTTDRKTIAVVLPRPVFIALRRNALGEHTNISSYVRELIKKDMLKQNRKRRKTDESKA